MSGDSRIRYATSVDVETTRGGMSTSDGILARSRRLGSQSLWQGFIVGHSWPRAGGPHHRDPVATAAAFLPLPTMTCMLSFFKGCGDENGGNGGNGI